MFDNHKPKSLTVVCFRERELCEYVQLIWIESRLMEGLDFERCADLEVVDGVDTTVTISSRLAIWSELTCIVPARMSMDGFDICVVLCCGCKVRVGTSRNSIARTNQEFERYANVENVCIANCQAEEGPMRIMNVYRFTIFQDVKIEVAVFMMKPNEESRRWLRRMRASKKECDVCSSLPQSLSVAESEFVEFARSKKHDDQFDEGVAQCARGANNYGSVTKQCGVGQVRQLLCVVLRSQERVSSDVIRSGTCRKAVNALKGTSTLETFRNVEDGMWRWTCSTDVVCGGLSCNGLSGAANPCNEETNLANLMKLRMSCRETLGSAIL